ncbi:glycosyltransferase family 4 protein [Sabulicella glaciei]|uniref:Glycosyltransferase family 4 protein n=1 Tax=Sabulicella glaciei TaxID=2984948 RepID=A0ABT3NRK4_9PROT|nr:glycosyltransferase family 4 protein [Roseococcus sp. MDT2-1-1]MCW8084794.1 glycosyltransferase family 4 protein [Roseococcus sp. MDT2-1-1]
MSAALDTATPAEASSRKLRILYSHRIQSRDGQGVHLDALVQALRQEGHEVRVVGPAAYDRAELGGESSWISGLRRALPAAVAEVAELGYSLPAHARLMAAAREFRPDVIYERYNLHYLAGAWLARRLRLPFLLEVNAPLAEERARFGNLALKGLARWSENNAWRAADAVLPVTGVLAEHVEAAGVPRDRIHVIPNGIHLEEFPEPVPRMPGQEVVLGFVGFVRDWHGLDKVVRGIAEWRGEVPLALTVVGEGPARPGLEALARELGIAERVRFTGLAQRHEVPSLVSDFDVALQPAAVPYCSPLKVFEYMAAGRAIVAPDQPNIREVLEHGRNALLFDPSDPEGFWKALSRLAGDPALRDSLGRAARREVIARDLTWEGNARRVAALAGKLLP